ncbi:MAG: hypothetical protein AB7G21_04245 [Dehalococcoidia bacterium]
MRRAGLTALLLAAAWLGLAAVASAQPRLPYQAYGSGVAANATIEAVHEESVLSSTRADAQGNWMLQVPADDVEDGDTIVLRVNGQRADQTITFRTARFSAPPGLALTVDGRSTGSGTPATSTTPGAGSASGTATPGATQPGAGQPDAAAEDGGGGMLLWAGLIALLAVAVAAGGVLLMRRRGIGRG